MKKVFLFLMVLFTMPVFAVKADTIGTCSFILNKNPLSELKSLEIMPDESITIFIEDPRGYDDSFKQIILEKEQQTDYNCGHITFKDIKDGKAIVEFEDELTYETRKIAPFTLFDYADTESKQEEIWDRISQWSVFHGNGPFPEMVQSFMDQWISVYGKEAFKKMLNKGLLKFSGIHGNVVFSIDFFLKHGADINATDENGENALFRVVDVFGGRCYLNDAQKISLLMSKGIDIYHKNNQGKTVFDIAREEANKGIYDDRDEESISYVKMLEDLSKSNDEMGKIAKEFLESIYGNHEERVIAYKSIADYIACENTPNYESIYMVMNKHKPTHNYKYASIPCLLFSEIFRCFEKCPPNFIHGEDGTCYPCDRIETITTTETECERCPERFFDNERDLCFFKDGKRDMFLDNQNTPHNCKEVGAFATTAEECAICVDESGNPLRIMHEGHCVLCEAGRFFDGHGGCRSCFDRGDYHLSAEECAKCKDENGNPIRKIYGQYCRLIECPEGGFPNHYGNCISCDEGSIFDHRSRGCVKCTTEKPVQTTGEECAKCVDENGKSIRKMYDDFCISVYSEKGNFIDSRGFFQSCFDKNPYEAVAGECAKCVDENGNPIRKMQDDLCAFVYSEKMYFISNDGNYRSCLEETPYVASAEECAKCMDENGNPIRKMYKVKNVFLNDGKSTIFTSTIKEVCGLIKCPEGKFPNNLGSCVSCSDEQPHSVDSAEACNSCKDTDGNLTRKIYKRKIYKNVIGAPMFDNRCGLINCPEGKFLNILGNCVPCATSQPEPVESAEACAACQDENGNPTRRMYKGTFNHPDVSDGCGLIECPKDMFLGKFGHCISCSDAREYDSTAEECAKCSDSRTYNSETQKCELKI